MVDIMPILNNWTLLTYSVELEDAEYKLCVKEKQRGILMFAGLYVCVEGG
jgi:hypothetical protein